MPLRMWGIANPSMPLGCGLSACDWSHPRTYPRCVPVPLPCVAPEAPLSSGPPTGPASNVGSLPTRRAWPCALHGSSGTYRGSCRMWSKAECDGRHPTVHWGSCVRPGSSRRTCPSFCHSQRRAGTRPPGRRSTGPPAQRDGRPPWAASGGGLGRGARCAGDGLARCHAPDNAPRVIGGYAGCSPHSVLSDRRNQKRP